MAELVALETLAFGTLRVRLRYLNLALQVRPGKFVDVRSHAGDADRLPVVAASPGIVELESSGQSALHDWLAGHATAGTQLRVAGPFDVPR
jgi:hypothetical protein